MTNQLSENKINILDYQVTLYDKFIEEMEKYGFRKVFANLDEKDVTISDEDDAIYITIKDSQSISIKGIREAKIRGKLLTHPHYIYLRVYDYNYEEARPEDAVQFSITELGKISSDKESHVVYYHYPYRTVVTKLGLKKGVVITKDKRLEIRIIRDDKPLKIGKFDINIECHKWYKNNAK